MQLVGSLCYISKIACKTKDKVDAGYSHTYLLPNTSYLILMRFVCGYFHSHKLEMGPTR